MTNCINKVQNPLALKNIKKNKVVQLSRPQPSLFKISILNKQAASLTTDKLSTAVSTSWQKKSEVLDYILIVKH